MVDEEPKDDEHPSFVVRQRERGVEAAGRARRWVDVRRDDAPTVDLAVHLYERDRETFAAVLGSAIALRLFLLVVPVIVAVVGFVNVALGSRYISDLMANANIKGGMATQIASATQTSKTGGIWILATGLFGTVWAGRHLTKVLAACAAGSWQMPGSMAKVKVKMALTVTGLLVLMLLVGSAINRLREHSGIAVATTSILVVGVVYMAGWFVVTWTMPRGTPDPGALLPGAALVGLGMALLQWFMQRYLPEKIARSSQTMGTVGVTVAMLGYLFFVGRLFAMSFVLDAVVFEKLGSISRLVFAVPVLRRIPRRWPSVAKFFDLPDVPAN